MKLWPLHAFASGMFGVGEEEMQHVGDDRIGRALDRLFDADRAALLTEIVVAIGQRFGVNFDEFHNDSTTVSFYGSYRAASGRQIRGRTAPAITYGHSKIHRPDLKQLLLILTMAADGNVPVAFRCTDGNASDARTHIETWETLRAVAGRPDFLYVADSKLCSRENMDYFDRAGGRFVTVLPRTRLEDQEFRQWIQTHIPAWELVWDRPNPRDRDGPRDRWSVYRAPLLSAEVWPIVWVWSTLLTLHQAPDAAATLPRPSRRSASCANDWPAPRPDCAAPPRSICRSNLFSLTITSLAISKSAASCANSICTSKPGAVVPGPIPPIASSQSGASILRGRSTKRPLPTTTSVMGCTR